MQLDGLARRQHGVLSRDQAREGGLSDKAIRCRLRTGRWRRIHPGVYLTHSGEISWLSRASAAILHSGRGATLTLTAAAYLWGLRDRPPPMITLTVPYERSVVRMPGTRVRRRRREVPGVTVRRLPVTTVPVTVLDLSDEPGCTAAEAVALAALASQGQQTTAADLLEELGRRRRHRHRQVLRLALGDINEGIESVAEHHYVQRVERAHGLPVFARQTSRPTAAGELRRDFESLEFGIVVEIDGRTWHGGVAFTADRRRDRLTAGDGKVTLRAGWLDVTEAACELAVDLTRTLWRRGWCGRPTPCSPTCPVARLGTRPQTGQTPGITSCAGS